VPLYKVKCPRCANRLGPAPKRTALPQGLLPRLGRQVAACVVLFQAILLLFFSARPPTVSGFVQPVQMAQLQDAPRYAVPMLVTENKNFTEPTEIAPDYMPEIRWQVATLEPANLSKSLIEGNTPFTPLMPSMSNQNDAAFAQPVPPGKGNALTVPFDPRMLATKLVLPVDPRAMIPEQRISFMGAVGTGRRFCIIADCSGSMKGVPLEAVKAELLRTLRSLQIGGEFFVILFNANAAMQPFPTWLPAGSGVSQIAPWILSAQAGGYTNPVPGFQIALSLNPRPDAIFFMTDGVVTVGTPREATGLIIGMNRQSPPVPVHSILFSHAVLKVGANGQAAAQQMAAQVQKQTVEMQTAAEVLRTIAAASGGTFTTVSLPASIDVVPAHGSGMAGRGGGYKGGKK